MKSPNSNFWKSYGLNKNHTKSFLKSIRKYMRIDLFIFVKLYRNLKTKHLWWMATHFENKKNQSALFFNVLCNNGGYFFRVSSLLLDCADKLITVRYRGLMIFMHSCVCYKTEGSEDKHWIYTICCIFFVFFLY